jgi:hypothetical protein
MKSSSGCQIRPFSRSGGLSRKKCHHRFPNMITSDSEFGPCLKRARSISVDCHESKRRPKSPRSVSYQDLAILLENESTPSTTDRINMTSYGNFIAGTKFGICSKVQRREVVAQCFNSWNPNPLPPRDRTDDILLAQVVPPHFGSLGSIVTSTAISMKASECGSMKQCRAESNFIITAPSMEVPAAAAGAIDLKSECKYLGPSYGRAIETMTSGGRPSTRVERRAAMVEYFKATSTTVKSHL